MRSRENKERGTFVCESLCVCVCGCVYVHTHTQVPRKKASSITTIYRRTTGQDTPKASWGPVCFCTARKQCRRCPEQTSSRGRVIGTRPGRFVPSKRHRPLSYIRGLLPSLPFPSRRGKKKNPNCSPLRNGTVTRVSQFT